MKAEVVRLMEGMSVRGGGNVRGRGGKNGGVSEEGKEKRVRWVEGV